MNLLVALDDAHSTRTGRRDRASAVVVGDTGGKPRSRRRRSTLGESVHAVQGRSGMYGGMIKVVALPGRRAELLEFLRWDAEVARAQEPGTLRFDVWEVPDEPDAFYLYEGCADDAAFEAHTAGEPFKKAAEIVE